MARMNRMDNEHVREMCGQKLCIKNDHSLNHFRWPTIPLGVQYYIHMSPSYTLKLKKYTTPNSLI